MQRMWTKFSPLRLRQRVQPLERDSRDANSTVMTKGGAVAQPDRLLVAVLGNPKAGKSTTWNTLFGQRVRTTDHPRMLELRPGEFVEVFLVNGSPEERHIYVGKILGSSRPRIVLCSVQYTASAKKTLAYFVDRRFLLFLQWLNPGRRDKGETWDKLGLTGQVLAHKGLVSIRNGRVSPRPRVQQLREYIYGWAKYRG